MKDCPFEIGDKVTLHPERTEWVATVPKLVPGRVYCVERVNFAYGNFWLRLVGVREHKLKCHDDRGVIPQAFRAVGAVQRGKGF